MLNEMAITLHKGDKVRYVDGEVYIVDKVRNDQRFDGTVTIKAHKGSEVIYYRNAEDFELIWE